LYGSDFDLYYEPILINVKKYANSRLLIVINTLPIYQLIIENFFAKYKKYIKVISWRHSCYCSCPKLLRFFVSEKVSADYYFYKDSDSVVTREELLIMTSFIYGRENYLIIRNHSLHVAPILAGMFGASAFGAKFISRTLRKRLNNNFKSYDYDQDLLAKYIYPYIRYDCAVFSSHFFFYGEKLFHLKPSHNYIGKKFFFHNDFNLDNFYNGKKLSLPFYRCVYLLLPGFIYGRVRPSLYLSKLFKVFK
jgi:hypothetical protein